MIFDGKYDNYRGVVMLVRVLEGTLSLKQQIRLWSNQKKFEVQELGVFAPFPRPVPQLIAGEVGVLVANVKELLDAKAHVEAEGIEVLGPTHHGIFKSIYFFDPNGHRVELAADIGTPEQYDELRRVAAPMLEEWSRTKQAPRHAAWLHANASAGGGTRTANPSNRFCAGPSPAA